MENETNTEYNQELPKEVEDALDAYITRIKNIKWFKPSNEIKREEVDTSAKVALSAFGVDASIESIEYRKLKKYEEWVAAWGAAWVAARGAARGASDVFASFTETYKLDKPFTRLVDIWEMGLYPVGVIDGKFIIYVPTELDELPEQFRN